MRMTLAKAKLLVLCCIPKAEALGYENVGEISLRNFITLAFMPGQQRDKNDTALAQVRNGFIKNNNRIVELCSTKERCKKNRQSLYS